MQENPMSAQGAMSDPQIAGMISKLVQAGIVKMG